jgi:agmatine/peptidylarginine deiminase
VKHHSKLAPLALAALLVFAGPALAANYRFNQGDPIQLSLGRVSSSYQVDWYSDVDGYLGTGSPIVVSTLSAGDHTITFYIFRVRDGALLYQSSVDVEIVARTSTPPPATGGTAPPPSTGGGSNNAPGEFEPVTTMLLGCPDTYLVDAMYPSMLKAIHGVATAHIYVDNNYARNDVMALLDQAGVSRGDYDFSVVPVDSIWMRDYGPLFTRKNGSLEIVDLDYYPERPNDDRIPQYAARELGLKRNALDLYWEGGNYTSDGRGEVFCTDAMLDENASYYSRSQISSMVSRAFGGTLTVLEHMLNDGGTGHMDMFCLMLGSNDALLNRFPSSSQNYARMERNRQLLEQLGISTRRIDLADRGFSSHTNGLIVNRVAMVPTYANSATDRAALAAYAAAGYQTFGIDSRKIIRAAGAIHCITITVPR